MGKIFILPPEIISKIAAGEVIERPASAIKELIENALDARAKGIDIELKQAGKTFIHMKDSGTGIEADDLEKMFFRHATSKITTLEDLYTINSLGFRGEALYSIASISDLTLRSKTETQETGWEIHLRGGKKLDLRPINMSQGTEVEIRELFFNTPARKKFLKSNVAELHQILNVIMPYTLLYNHCRFSLKHNTRTLLDLIPEDKRINRVSRALNLNREYIIEKDAQFPQENISIKLFLGDINIRRAKRDLQFIFINNRPVQNRSLNYSLNQAYKLILPSQTYPFFLADIHLPVQNIDVNIHPTKREVKIKNERKIASLLHYLCEQALMRSGKPKQAYQLLPETAGKNLPDYTIFPVKSPGSVNEPPPKQYILSPGENTSFFDKKGTVSSGNDSYLLNEKDSLKNKLSFARYIGIFIRKYLLFEGENSLLLIDQHAAQERITYEKLRGQIEQERIEIQHLLSPVLIRMSPQEILIWETAKDKLQTIGLNTTLWDKETIALHACPQLITNPELAIRGILGEKNVELCDIETLARRACKQSLTTGYKMEKTQAEYLRRELIKCKDPFTCPHGRPTVIEIQEKALDKQFLRKT